MAEPAWPKPPEKVGISENSAEEQNGVLSAEQTAKVLEGYLQTTSLRTIASLIEANNILTINGERAQTEYFINNPTGDDRQQLEALNEDALRTGIYFSVDEAEFTSPSNGVRILMVGIFNAKCLERQMKKPPLPGLPAFYAQAGVEGLSEWFETATAVVERAQREGKIPAQYDAVDIIIGIVKGYPLVAVYDFQEWLLAGGTESEKTLEVVRVPSVDLYGGARPEFDVAQEHINNSEVTSVALRWEDDLSRFYATDWHRKLQANEAFASARKILTE